MSKNKHLNIAGLSESRCNMHKFTYLAEELIEYSEDIKFIAISVIKNDWERADIMPLNAQTKEEAYQELALKLNCKKGYISLDGNSFWYEKKGTNEHLVLALIEVSNITDAKNEVTQIQDQLWDKLEEKDKQAKAEALRLRELQLLNELKTKYEMA